MVLASLLGVLESQAVLMLCPCCSGETPRVRVQGHRTCASAQMPDKLWSVPLSTCSDLQVPTGMSVRLESMAKKEFLRDLWCKKVVFLKHGDRAQDQEELLPWDFQEQLFIYFGGWRK